MSNTLQLPKLASLRPRIVVVGVGGAGSNAVNNMISSGLTGVTFVVANTDAQSLANSTAEHRIQLGATLTEGLGAGARPEIGKAAAEEAIEEIRSHVTGAHMVFVAAGMGGGTGTGAAAVIARLARQNGALTVGVVTKPFQFEGTRRMRAAEIGVATLKPEVDTLIVIPNQNLFRIANERTTFAEAFVLADQVLYSGIACVVDLIIKEGLINLDFADVRTVMSGMGTAMMGTGEASGQGRAVAAAEEAISNPLLDDISLRGARGLLVSITGNREMTLYEVDEAANRVRDEVDPEATIIVGATYDEALGDRIRVSIVASGMERLDEQVLARAQFQQQGQLPAANAHLQMQEQLREPLVQLSSMSPSGPPALPSAAQRHAEADPIGGERHLPDQSDLTQAISAALGTGHAPTIHSYGQPPPPPGWSAQSGAVFAEAPPQLPPQSEHDDARYLPRSPEAGGHFSPHAPAEPPRGSRRLPTVEDFPPLAQREYQAKAGQYAGHQGDQSADHHAERSHTLPPPRAYTHATPEPPRKLGFFQRLMGARRAATPTQAETAVHPQASPKLEKHRPPRSGSSHPAAQAASGSGTFESSEADDLPVIFGAGRK
jgi:cell division protein FtsZ